MSKTLDQSIRQYNKLIKKSLQ